MAHVNLMIIAGVVGNDPRSFQFNGTQGASFSVGVSEKKKGQDERETTWFNVTSYDKRAEYILKNVKKRDIVHITGPISVKHYNDKDGNLKIDLCVMGRDIKIIKSFSDNSSEYTATNRPSPAQKVHAASADGNRKQYNEEDDYAISDDDIPF